MRVVFLGTPEFAVPSLEALLTKHEVAAVFTQPDRPKGRGNVMAEPPVKRAAAAHGLDLYQPQRIRRPGAIDQMTDLRPDLMVVVGYGQIIPQAIIDIPKHGILNVHASLLPKYRGAAPIQWAIASGETETGVTIMQIDAGLDTGDMLLKSATAIGPDETAPELSARLAPKGAQLLLEAIDGLERSTIDREKQNDREATYAPILNKEDGRIDWARSAFEIYNRLRGFTPWPGAYSTFRGLPFLILRAKPLPDGGSSPGLIQIRDRRLFVGCRNETALDLIEVQPAGKKRMSAEAFLNGYKLSDNERLGD